MRGEGAVAFGVVLGAVVIGGVVDTAPLAVVLGVGGAALLVLGWLLWGLYARCPYCGARLSTRTSHPLEDPSCDEPYSGRR